jgi:hypothetical protein
MKMLKNHSEMCFQHFLGVFGEIFFLTQGTSFERSDIKN